MTAINPIFASADLGGLIEITFTGDIPATIDRVKVRYRGSDNTEIPANWMNPSNGGSFFNAVKRLAIEYGWTTIGNSAFYGWTSATSLTLPDSLTSVDDSAFYGWTSATSLTLPDSLTSIGSNAFSGWTLPTSLVLPNALTSVGVGAFSGWVGPTSLAIPPSAALQNNSFSGWVSLETLTFKEGATATPAGSSAGWATFAGASSLKTIDLPSTVATIGNHLTPQTMTSLEALIVRAATPPTLAGTSLSGFSSIPDAMIYVPDASVDAYKAANVWVNYADRIFGLSDLPE